MNWPWHAGNKSNTGKHTGKKKSMPFITISNSTNILMHGSGKIDGQGYMWWFREFLKKNIAHRPKLMTLETVKGFEFTGIFVTNSPSFHIVPSHSEDFYFHDFELYVDIVGIFELNRMFYNPFHSFLEALDTELPSIEFPLPMFPLNTDGIDAEGRNITFRRLKITNFDDAIVPKPSNGKNHPSCTTEVLAEDIDVTFGVGMSIGSVPPNNASNCI